MQSSPIYVLLGSLLLSCAEESFGCRETPTPLKGENDAEGLSFSLKEKLAELSPFEADTTWLPGSMLADTRAGVETRVKVELSYIDGDVTRIESERGPDGGFNEAWQCTRSLEAQIAIHLTTDDGALNEELVGSLRAYEIGITSFVSAILFPQDLVGNLELVDTERVSLSLEFAAGQPSVLNLSARGPGASDPDRHSGSELVALPIESLIYVESP